MFITPPVVAKRLGVSPDKVLGWIAKGELAAVNVGNGHRPRWRISPESIEEFLTARANQRPNKQQRRPRSRSRREYF